ncbi:patatin-like phospholipase domain-containing protein 2 isoform X1 [Nerophis lumbriciformis]|uniref:patatin-like phospholipase domain-containing protein 2 isoform X1 n=1 Tax=Nerophis lumbriciformis TaxID=546530 RepID=UPI002ADF656F|nr:patatin-like phospholipase domain-containing protein 2 isoform X1 [Nerophis lumbriciformis]
MDEEWNISMAGCGFRSVYYLGALTCILERAPRLVHGASRICGASSGCLVAAALTVGLPVEHLCVDVLSAAKEARRHHLSVFHPNFSLLRTVRDSLQEKLPQDAHLRASGRLCVSLTRMSNWKNVLVSQFDSREELIQVLICSCFFPFYCGFMPPSYRGELFMDGALSNNMPLFEQRNTITLAPFCSESDICPKDGAFTCVSVHYANLSIQVTTGNVHRICTSFLPPALEELADVFHGGYADALRFLRQGDLLGPSSWQDEGDSLKSAVGLQEDIPLSSKKAMCAGWREAGHVGAGPPWQLRILFCLLTPLVLAAELIFFLIKSLLMTTNNLIGQRRSRRRQQAELQPLEVAPPLPLRRQEGGD